MRRGSSAALVLRGDAGMGETTLLEYALRSAADMRTVRLVGVQSDSGFGFGALHRLFIPFHGSHRVPSGSSARCDRDGLRVSWTAPRRGPSVFGRVGNSDGVFGGSCRAGASVPGDDVHGSTGSPLTCWVSLHVDSCWRGCPDSTLRASTNIQGLAGDDCQFVDGFLRIGLSENRRPGFRCWVLSPPPNSIGGPVIGGRRFLVRGCMPR